MASSAVLSIYSALAGLTITGVKATRDLPDVKLVFAPKDLPLRLLLPSTHGDLSYIAIGTLNKVDWAIRDLCLWAPLTSGKGIEQFSEDMLQYVADYIAALKGLRNPTAQSVITQVGFQMGPVPWADTDYWAVDTNLIVEEVM